MTTETPTPLLLSDGIATAIAEKWGKPWAKGFRHRKHERAMEDTIIDLLRELGQSEPEPWPGLTWETNGIMVRRVADTPDCVETEVFIKVWSSSD